MVNNSSAIFSIIIPVMNGGGTLERLFGSLIMQRNRIREVLVCNDHSTDNTVEVAERYKGILPVTVLNVPDELGYSPGNARQIGLDYASGEWAVFADADDLLTFNALGFYDCVIKGNGDVNMIVAAFDEVNFDPLYLIDHHNLPLAWVHAKAFRMNYVKKNNLRFSKKLYTHEDKYFTNLNLFMMRANGEPEPFVSDTTTYYWCRGANTIVSKNDGKYPMTSLAESSDAVIEPIAFIAKQCGMSDADIKKMFGTELKCTIFDMYHKVQCSIFKWGFEELEKYDVVDQVKTRVNRIMSLAGMTADEIIAEVADHPETFNDMKQDSIRTIGDFAPRQTIYDFLDDCLKA